MYVISATDDTLHTSFVGFTVFKKSSQDYSIDTEIIFDGILLNPGNDFRPSINKFICPFSGIYFASVNFRKNFRNTNTDSLYLNVVQEGVAILRSSEDSSSTPGNTVSNSGLFRCLEGQRVWVSGADTGSVYGDPSKAFTTFSIVLMYEYDIYSG